MEMGKVPMQIEIQWDCYLEQQYEYGHFVCFYEIVLNDIDVLEYPLFYCLRLLRLLLLQTLHCECNIQIIIQIIKNSLFQQSYPTIISVIQSVMKQERLDTQGLIQSCRNNYNMSKIQQKVKQLQLLLQLRTKEKDMISHKVITLKEQYMMKISYLENQATQLKRQCADLRLSSVKNKRMQHQKAQRQIESIKQSCDLLIQKQRQENMIICKQLELKHRQQVNRLQEQYQRMIKLGKDQRQSYKNMFQNGTQKQTMMRVIEQEKGSLIRAKKDVQSMNEMLKQILAQKQQQYGQQKQENEQMMTKLNSQILGLRLQQKMLRQRLQVEKIKQFDNSSALQRQIQSLKFHNSKLQAQNQKYKKLLLSKNEQIAYKQSESVPIDRKIIKQVVQCNHSNLIRQLQRSLNLKTQQNEELKSIIESWSAKIQFDQPLSSRISQIEQKRYSALQANNQISNILKPKVHRNNAKTLR